MFAGGFDLTGGRSRVALDIADGRDMADLLRNLVDKSMVIADRDTAGTRYPILETLRQFGQDQLGDSERTSAIRTRHLLHFIDVAENAHNLFRTSEQLIGTGLFDREWDNLRVRALEWALQTRDLPAAERMLNASFQYALSVMRIEHGDWARRPSHSVPGSSRPGPTPLLRARIGRSMWKTKPGRTIPCSRTRPRDFHGRPRRPVHLGNVSDRHGRACAGPLLQLEIVAANLDLDREWWVLIDLADKLSTSRPIHLARLVETAERVRAPTLLVEAAVALVITRPKNSHRTLPPPSISTPGPSAPLAAPAI